MVQPPGGWSDLTPSDAKREPLDDRDFEGPYVLFDDARFGRTARAYSNPIGIVECRSLSEVRRSLAKVAEEVRKGRHAAGYITYEAGRAFEPRLASLRVSEADDAPLLWFGLFECATFGYLDEPDFEKTDQRPLLKPACSSRHYQQAVREVLALINAGDCYQINLTFQSLLQGIEDPSGLFRQLRKAQRGGWGGHLYTGAKRPLSFSPELFFAQDGSQIVAKPMKGTIQRRPNCKQDNFQKKSLATSLKDRAENLMIVDLLRNDLSRIAVTGSVRVARLFQIETYPTVHQMTSTITAFLKPDLSVLDILEAMFPCGSITGAPKFRAMEIINELELQPRGTYTGSMGFIDPDGTSAFNVLIRSIDMGQGGTASMGLGAGIVADSDPVAEWKECVAKAAFLNARLA